MALCSIQSLIVKRAQNMGEKLVERSDIEAALGVLSESTLGVRRTPVLKVADTRKPQAYPDHRLKFNIVHNSLE